MGERFFPVRVRVVAVASYCIQVQFFFQFGLWRPIFVVGTVWECLSDNFVGLCSLGFSSDTTCTYVGTGPFFGDSQNKIRRGECTPPQNKRQPNTEYKNGLLIIWDFQI